FSCSYDDLRYLHSFPTRRSSDLPDIGVRVAQHLSVKNKLISGDEDKQFLGEESEWLAQYSKRKLETKHYEYFVFGHRHLPMEIRSEEHTSELQSRENLVCRLLLE